MPSSDCKCYTKAVLELIAERAGVSHLALYGRLLAASASMVLPKISSDPDVAKMLYGDEPSKPPKLVHLTDSMALSSLQNCLSSVAGRRIGLLFTYDGGGWKCGTVRAFYSGETERVMFGREEEQPPQTVIWAKIARSPRRLKSAEFRLRVWLAAPGDVPPTSLLESPPALCSDTPAQRVDGCLLRALARLLGVGLSSPDAPAFPSFQSMMPVHGEAVGRDAVQTYIGDDVRVLLTTHEGFSFNACSLRQSRAPKNQKVEYLGVLGARPHDPADDGLVVVGATSAWVYLYPDEFSKAVTEDFNAVNETRPGERPDLSRLSPPGAGARPAPGSTGPRFPCPCEMCEEKLPPHRFSMGKTRPQKKHAQPACVTELMLACGLKSPDNVERVEQALRISSLAWDVESFNSRTRSDFPNDVSEPISYRKPAVGITGVQEICLVGVTDFLCAEGYVTARNDASVADSNFAFFERRDGEKNGDELLFRFYVYVISRCKALTARKRELLSPIFEEIEKFRDAHMAYYSSKEIGEKQAASCFAANGFGLLKTKLERVCRKNFLWGFNASRYDSILCMSGLAAAAKRVQPSCRVGLIKQGSTIKMISFKSNGLAVVDLCGLTGRGFSLRALSRVTGVASDTGFEKGRFPFKAFTSPDFLKRTSLPSLPSAYQDLSGNVPSQEEVDATLAEFAEDAHPDVRSYILKYLKSDCALLQLSARRLIETLTATAGISPMETSPFLSSFAIRALHSALFKKKRFAFFHLESGHLERWARHACIGGLAVAYRSESGESTSALNSHIVKGASKPARVAVYMDQVSLYGGTIGELI